MVAINKQQTVSYQGIPGAYSFVVAKHLFPKAQLMGCETFTGVFEQLIQRHTSFGVLPIENSIAGSVAEVLDLLLEYHLPIVQEISLHINHHLLALPQIENLSDIRFVHSHPKALEQCRLFFKTHPHLKAIPEFDTAGSAQLVAQKGDPTHAAIASGTAGKLWQLKQLNSGIQSNSHNFTRFVVIAKTTPKNIKPQKTSLVFTLPHVTGSLVKALEVFKSHSINLTKIESRPLVGKPWEYRFFVDIENNSHTNQAILELERRVTSLTILGSYPKGITITEN